MTRHLRSMVTVEALLVAAFVLGAAIVQTVRQGNLAPLWTIGWLPAAVVAGLYRAHTRGQCWPRRASRSEP